MLRRRTFMWCLSRVGGVWLVLACCSWVAAYAADSELDDALRRVSFNGAQKAGELGSVLAELSPEALAELCDRLVEPGTGDDTQARMALNGLTWYTASDGSAVQRAKYIGVLCAALEGDRPSEVKTFLIRQLQLVGDERAVPALGALLGDEQLYNPAAQALLAIGGERAATAFREALPSAQGPQRVAVIDALGVLRDQQSVPILAKDAEAASEDVRAAAIAALANIGGEAAAGHVRMPPGSASWSEVSQAWGRLLRACRQSDKPVLPPWMLPLLPQPSEDGSPKHLTHVRCAALHDMAEAFGAAGVPEVVVGMASQNPEIRMAAIETAVTHPGEGVTAAYVEQMEKDETPPALRADILKVLERRGDATAFSAAQRALEDPDKRVRIAAISAVAALDEDRAAGQLVSLLYDREDQDERQAVQQALAGMRGARASEYLGLQMESAPPPARVALIEVLADRRARGQLNRIYAAAEEQDEDVRLAAIRAIGTLGDEKAAPKLLKLLSPDQSEDERRAVEEALAAVCGRAADSAAGSKPLLAALKPADEADYASLLRVLGHVGGTDALEAVRAALKDGRSEIRDVAIDALREWPDSSAAQDLLAVARDAEELKRHVLALRGFARLAALDDGRPASERVNLLAAGLEVARRADEKKLMLARLADVHDREAGQLLYQVMSAEDELRPEAASAMLTVAEHLLPTDWEAAADAADAVLEFEVPETISARAEQLLRRVEEDYEGFITDWLVAGPFMQPNKTGQEVFDVAFPPEQDGSAVEWLSQPVSDDAAQYWLLNILANQSIRGNNRAAYLRTYVFSPRRSRPGWKRAVMTESRSGSTARSCIATTPSADASAAATR